MNIDKRYINQIEILTNVFTIDKNKLKVYLIKRTSEPYKGYWMLPSNLLLTTETIEECAEATVLEFIGLEKIFLKQCNIFSKVDRLPNDRILGNSMIGLVDSETLSLRKKRTIYEGVWFSIDEIPKMVFDHGIILLDSIKQLKNYINDVKILKILFPSDFTIPELQYFFEQVLGKKLDRRNFRKKVINMLEDTGYKTSNKMGRPAKLYRLKEDGDDIYE